MEDDVEKFKEKRRRLEEFLQHLWTEDDPEEDRRFISKWCVVVELSHLNGNKTIGMRKSSMPAWDALGLLTYGQIKFTDELATPEDDQ